MDGSYNTVSRNRELIAVIFVTLALCLIEQPVMIFGTMFEMQHGNDAEMFGITIVGQVLAVAVAAAFLAVIALAWKKLRGLSVAMLILEIFYIILLVAAFMGLSFDNEVDFFIYAPIISCALGLIVIESSAVLVKLPSKGSG